MCVATFTPVCIQRRLVVGPVTSEFERSPWNRLASTGCRFSEILEARGIAVYPVVDAAARAGTRDAKVMWLTVNGFSNYHTLRRCFQTEEGCVALHASLVRQREGIRCRSTHILHMQKALQMMNIQLMREWVGEHLRRDHGLVILPAILTRERNQQLAHHLRNGR